MDGWMNEILLDFNGITEYDETIYTDTKSLTKSNGQDKEL